MMMTMVLIIIIIICIILLKNNFLPLLFLSTHRLFQSVGEHLKTPTVLTD